MRYLLILSLLFGFSAQANWMSASDIALVNAGDPGATNYVHKSLCEKREHEKCYNTKGHDLARESIQTFMTDDTSKALYGPKLNVQGGFIDLETCQLAMHEHCDDQDPGYDVRAVCALETAMTTYEIYCIATSPQSYKQKEVTDLAPDASLKTNADAREAKKLAKENKAKDAKTILRNAVENWKTINAVEQKEILRELVRLLIGE